MSSGDFFLSSMLSLMYDLISEKQYSYCYAISGHLIMKYICVTPRRCHTSDVISLYVIISKCRIEFSLLEKETKKKNKKKKNKKKTTKQNLQTALLFSEKIRLNNPCFF